MSKLKSDAKGYRDVFNAFLVSSASYSEAIELPNIQHTSWIPNKLISFSKAISCRDYDQWVHFYEYDHAFERIWRNPKRYLNILRRFNGVILPDFSVYRDMPLVMQLWNIYRSRAIGSWLQENEIRVIVNMRWGDERTYRICCEGVTRKCTIAVGTNGTIRNPEDRRYFVDGLETIASELDPSSIVVYGSAPDDIFGPYRSAGIKIVQFDCETTSAHREAK